MTTWSTLRFPIYISSHPVPIKATDFTIGRSQGCSFTISDNKLVSGVHCKLEIDPMTGQATLEDRSSNGCIINGRVKLSRGQRAQLADGDIVHIVKKKSHSDDDISFTYNTVVKEHVESPTQLLEPEEVGEELEPGSPLHHHEPLIETPTQSMNFASADSLEPLPKQPRLGEGEKAAAAAGQSKPSEADEMAENLQCSICCEIIHDCVSLQPCLHAFCSGCYSGWMERSNHCPECRQKVDRLSRDHKMNNIIEAHLKSHPEMRRTKAELEELDAKNKITEDMIHPKRKRKSEDDSLEFGSEGEESFSDTDEDPDEEPMPAGAMPILFPAAFIPPPPPRVTCRQCPGHANPPGCRAPAFICGPVQNHMLCQCCFQPLPDRRPEPNLPPLSCDLCHRVFCHAYWGCRRPGCVGCINRFSDLNFAGHLNRLLLNNQFESEILNEYVVGRGETWRELVQTCLRKLDAGEVTLDGAAAAVRSNSGLCFSCGLLQFQQLAYQYRKDIPADQLAQRARGRPDCYWGRGCRTQRSKPQHAQRLNHICEQTRFM